MSFSELVERFRFQRCSSFAGNFTCQLFQVIENDQGLKRFKPIGTGILITDGELFFLVSAAHVLDLGYIQSMCIPFTNSGWVFLKGQIHVTSVASAGIRSGDKIDLAFIQLEADVVNALKTAYKFLPLTIIGINHQMTKGMNYVVSGFPAKLTEAFGDEEKKVVKSKLLLARTQINTQTILAQKGFNECWNLNFDYKNSPVTPMASGLSGSGIWYVNPKSSSPVELIAIATHCFPDKPDEIISGIKIDLIADSLAQLFGIRLTKTPSVKAILLPK